MLPSTRHTYMKALKALLTHTSRTLNLGPVNMYLRSLVATGALVPTHQAKPLTAQQADKLATKSTRPGQRTAVRLTWKGCCRWMEVASLTRDRFKTLTPNRIVIAWGQTTKSGRTKPYSKSMYTVIEGRWTPEIYADVLRLPQGQPLTRTSASALSAQMKRLFGPGYSSHSIKHGAVTYLMRLVAEGKLTLEEVALLAKHASVETTLRYAGDPETMALALGTQRATQLL